MIDSLKVGGLRVGLFKKVRTRKMNSKNETRSGSRFEKKLMADRTDGPV
jgi:hypothetical protein